MTNYLPESPLSSKDAMYLRDAIRMSQVAKQRGNRPFGAVVIAKQGTVLAEASCNTTETGDCTGPAETTAGPLQSPLSTREEMADSTA